MLMCFGNGSACILGPKRLQHCILVLFPCGKKSRHRKLLVKMNISGWEKFAQRTNYFHQVVLRNSLFNLKKKVGREDSLVKIKISRWKLFAHRANYFHNIHAMNCLFFGLFTEKNIQLRNKKSVFTEGRLPSSTYFHLCETLHEKAQLLM